MQVNLRSFRRALLGCVAAFALQSAQAQTFDASSDATLTYFDPVGNETLDPRTPQNGSSFAQGMMMAIYDQLVLLDRTGTPKPSLAESWSYNSELTEFTMKLRHGVVFHDGSKFNAEAVRANFQQQAAIGTRAGSNITETAGAIAAVEVVDEFTVRLKLKSPNAQMPFLLGMQAGMMIAPAAIADSAFGTAIKPIGAGPFKVRAAESNVSTFTVRHDPYWGGNAGRPAVFNHHYVTDGRARLNAVRSGQANLVLIEPRQIQEAKAAGLEVRINEKNSTWDIYINVARDSTKDLRLRQAMMHALDREAIAGALGYGASTPTTQLFASSSPVYDKALENIYPFDPAKAKKLLAEAGFPNGIDVNWLLLNTTEYRPIAEAIQAMWAEAGIRVKFDIVDPSNFTQFRRGPRGDIMMARWGGRPEPLQAFQDITGTGGLVNPGGPAVPEIDTLIAKARAMLPDDPARLPVLKQLARVTTEQVSHIGIMTRSNIYAFRPGCINGPVGYLPTGNDRMNDVQVSTKCK